MIKLYNTLTRKKETIKPLNDNLIGLYCCGPTVYWYAHLGNLRAYIFEDVLRRVLEYNGFSVKHVMNYTDVGHLTSDEDSGEDKMEKGAKREGKTAWEIAEFYIKAFENDARALNILEPTFKPRATENIEEQITLIKTLEEKGFTYKIADGIYFNTSKLKDYGKLARLDIEKLKAGARIEMVEGKKNPTDFALWKFSPANSKRQMEWESPWGLGFPGWHIECSAMSQKYLGEQFDIHCGGIDHIPTHHTNEIAQSEAAFGKIPARFWLHSEFLLIDGGKMAKSDENFLTVKTLIDKRFNPLAYRYLTLTAHYRSKLNFTWESLAAAQSALDSLYNFYLRLNENPPQTSLKGGIDSPPLGGVRGDLKNKLNEIKKQFLAALNDDLNTPEALAIVWKLIKDADISDADKKSALLDFDKVLGLGLEKIRKIEIPEEIKQLAKEREEARKNKDWAKADQLRKKIQESGWDIEDTPDGPKIVNR
ncbi:MAG: cysteine--tRNA ligase [Candidatus Portnoybacteria bacterium]|nr:cysteine--tRNA ligase [Candidatus Portnoybacteria bacterium]